MKISVKIVISILFGLGWILMISDNIFFYESHFMRYKSYFARNLKTNYNQSWNQQQKASPLRRTIHYFDVILTQIYFHS